MQTAQILSASAHLHADLHFPLQRILVLLMMSTCPPLSKILAQSFITVISFTTMLFPECMLSVWQMFMIIQGATIFEQTCSSNCMLHELEKLVGSNKPKRGHRFSTDHSLGFHPYQQTVGRGEQTFRANSDTSSFKLGCCSSGPKAFEGFKKFNTPSVKP